MGTRPEVRNARIYLVGLAASLIGDSAMSLVSGIWVLSLTGSPSAAALVSVFVYGPSLLGPFAGMLADRVRRRPLLLVVNLGAAGLMLPLVFVHPVWLIYVVMLGYGLVAVLIDSAESALFAVMLPAPVRMRFNGLRLTLQEGGKLVAPLLGAGLFAVLGGGPVAALDATTFAFAALMITRLRVTEAVPTPGRVRWWAEVTGGFRHIWRDPVLRSLVVAAGLAMIISGVGSAARFSLVEALGQSPGFLGLLAGALGAGSIVAGLTSRFVGGRLGVLGLINGVAGNALPALGTVWAALLGSFVLGFALPWTVIAVLNLSQSRTPDRLQGRVAAAISLALFAPQPLAHAAGVLAVAQVPYRWLYLGVAAAFMALAWRLASRPTPNTPPGHPAP